MKQKFILNKSAKPNITLRRKIRFYWEKMFFILKITLVLLICLGYFTETLNPIKRWVVSHLYESAAEEGLVLENVLIEGQHNVSTEDIAATLNADVRTPLLSIPIEHVREVLLKNDWIKNVIIERRFPSTIYINITEREPIAIWQQNKKLYLVDDEGHVITPSDIVKFTKLPHIIGSDAPLHVASLLHNIESDTELKKHILSSVRYGERRWNLILEQDITVKMPEVNFVDAYQYLSKLYKSNKLFDQDYKVIDLRDPSKYFFEKNKPAPAATTKKK
mgnify:FL=1